MNAPHASRTRWQHHASCKTCGYPLRNLPNPICPECGKAFDPHDPKTMRVRAWINWLDRTLSGGPGWMSHLFCALPLLLAIGAITDVVNIGDVVIWSLGGVLLVSLYWPVRLITCFALRSYYGRERAGRPRWIGWFIAPACVVITVIIWWNEIIVR